jgi:hypothetical protein
MGGVLINALHNSLSRLSNLQKGDLIVPFWKWVDG